MSLQGSKVLVIGGASGVGFAVAAAALEAGAQVVVGSSQAARVEAAAAKLGGGAKGYTVDVKDEASVAGFFEAAGAFDHLIFVGVKELANGGVALRDQRAFVKQGGGLCERCVVDGDTFSTHGFEATYCIRKRRFRQTA